jgi:asparagine synthase (glutamine-hydrolysing)
MMVSKLAREHVKVALSGDGGDEQFLGYGSYLWSKRLQNPLIKNLSAPIHFASKTMTNRYQRAGKLFEKYPANHFKSHLFSQDQYFFSENELNTLLINTPFNFDEINSCYEPGRKLDWYEKQSFWDLKNYLKDDLLIKVDRASMHFGLETRVPLLDTRLIEFSLNLSSELKLKNNITKYLLKEILYDLVPRKLFDRPKWGFGIPLSKWLKTDLKWMIKKYCTAKMSAEHGIFKPDQIVKLVKEYLSGRDYLYNRIWVIIITHWFIEENG